MGIESLRVALRGPLPVAEVVREIEYVSGARWQAGQRALWGASMMKIVAEDRLVLPPSAARKLKGMVNGVPPV